MANAGAGNKFVSVNLNKSYGQNYHHNHHHSVQHHHYGSNRARSTGAGGGGGGGGMVVLSRPRSSHKASGTKLSVPPPLNLPSLRKEHERFDSLGNSAGGNAGGSGNGNRPGSSGMGWTKPAVVALLEKEGFTGENSVDGVGNNYSVDQGVSKANGGGSSSSVYMPPSARLVGPLPVISAPSQGLQLVERATVLRGEDFPSLQAALPGTLASEKKQKDGLNHRQKLNDALSSDLKEISRMSALVDMRPQSQSRNNINSRLDENSSGSRDFGRSVMSEKSRKKEDYFSGPLPLVRLNLRSDWADDERDTGLGFTERARDNGFSKNEGYWDRDFDFPRPSVLPQKPAHPFDRRGLRDNEAGKFSSSEVAKLDNYGRDVRTPSRDGRESNSWRVSSPLSKEVQDVRETEIERNGIGARSSSLSKETTQVARYMPSPSRDNLQGDVGRRDLGSGHGGRQPWSNMMDSFSSRGTEWNRDRSYSEQYNRYRGENYQSSSVSKSSFSSGGKGLPVNDPILNFGRGKRPFSKTDKHYLEDPFMKDFGDSGFDGRDPFSGAIVGLVKKKKDVLKQTDFHDPVRESFEAELERVQKMQEQERQRMIEEQERAMELARREEEERMRLVKEQEEHQRRLEEEAKEAAWRAEQERAEALRRAEEQRVAREEEKHRVLMEEERRKQAAKQKLLELEEKIAKRQCETAKPGSNNYNFTDDKMSGITRDRDSSDWEERERMVDGISASASSDLLGVHRSFEMSSRSQFPRDGSSAISDRGKLANSWNRESLDSGNSSSFPARDQENSLRSPRRDASVGGRGFYRKEFYGGPGFMSSRTYHKGVPDPHLDDFSQMRSQRWNVAGDADQYNRSMEVESEFTENIAERYGDSGWGQGRSRGYPYPSFHERMYQNPEADGIYSFGRSRYSMRQPRVLPPPSMAPIQKSPFRVEKEHPGSSTFVENGIHYNHGVRNDSSIQKRFEASHQENLGGTDAIDDAHEENIENEAQKPDRDAARCDSQSSLSVSSPPDSPVHLSHDDLDESGDSQVLPTGESKDTMFAGEESESAALPDEDERENLICGSSVNSVSNDEEWAIENDDQLQEQEEYDEDEDGYGEEDEVHDGEDENIDLTQEFVDLHLEEKGSTDMMDNLVLGFNEGVEVGIPNDEFERSSGNEDTKFNMPQNSVSSVEEQRSSDGICSAAQTLQPVLCSPQVSVEKSSRIFQENVKTMQDLVIQPKTASQASGMSELIGHGDASGGSGLSSQTQIPSSLVQTVMSSVTSAPSQPEVPVKLQFGLFSGPSLIPSPVPAIQIGSIQMPLHLHSPIGPSLTHMHPSQPPLFQFGQLRYTSPVSQGVLPLTPQPMSFVQTNVPANYALNQNVGGSTPVQNIHHSPAHNLMKSEALSVSADNQLGSLPQLLNLSQGTTPKDGNLLPQRESAGAAVKVQQGQGEISHGDDNLRTDRGFQAGHSFTNSKPLHCGDLQGQPKRDPVPSQPKRDPVPSQFLKDTDFGASRSQSVSAGGRGKRYVFTSKHSVSRSPLPAFESSRSDSTGFQRRPRRQRTEFRVRENPDKRQSDGVTSSNLFVMDDNSNGGRANGARNASRRSTRHPKQTSESEGSNSRAVSTDGGSRVEKGGGKESLRKNITLSGDDVDASLQSGVVRVFEQHGIEAPSDDDNFIQVRSKRQMLNDRREQREKETKAKSRASKMPRKLRSTAQSTIGSSKSVSREAPKNFRSNLLATEGNGLTKGDASAGFNNPKASQSLAPIGTPAVKADVQADIRSQTIKSFHANPGSAVSGGGANLEPGLIFENKNKVLDNVQTSLSSWGNSRVNQQVVSLTQTQLDEAMKPAPYDPHPSVGDPANSAGEPSLPSSSILAKDKSFSSTSSPVNSLLAGEKIQFGAVTSPTMLPPNGRAVSHGIGPPGPSRSEIQISRNLSASETDCSLFFDKDKHSSEGCANLEDCEAEAAASAVAVAAIGNDEIVRNGLGVGTVASMDSKIFGAADIDGVSGDREIGSQSRADESLSVSLPADLSVETPPISLWPHLQSPQNSSSQMLSHIPGAQPSHYPFYEMNPMLGGPVFAFGPHDDSAAAQSQSQKSNASVSGPLPTWQHHSGVDSFYGPSAGFSGPFISPHGSIPGVQGPPHMVVYNHFAPVGQFGQVGLSFMGATYIPPGKQPDWKHNPTSSAMSTGEGEMNNLNMVSAQRNSTNMHGPIQHLAPGSPLLPMASPMPMFDVSPFQSSPDASVQARWSHVPTSHIQSVPVSMPLQQPTEGVRSSQFNHGPPVDQQLAAKRFAESQTPTPPESSRSFAVTTDATVTQLPDELGLVDSSNSTAAGSSSQSIVARSASAGSIPDASKANTVPNGNYQNMNSTYKNQSSHQTNTSSQQHANSSGYNYQKGGGLSQKNGTGGEWSHRRMGYQGRNQSSGVDKSYASSKTKQIYVAKKSTSGTSGAS